MSGTQKPLCTLHDFCRAASAFAGQESEHWEPSLYGVTDGKKVGTYLEHKFQAFVASRYEHVIGSSASGIDCPALGVDIKVTSIKQPQSSCPFSHAEQKVYGLGYSLLLFVYDKTDDASQTAANLTILHTLFIEAHHTADYQTTIGIRNLLGNGANKDDIVAFLAERNLPLDDIGANQLADKIMRCPPQIGYLTISNALQWRLQYARIIDVAGREQGIYRL